MRRKTEFDLKFLQKIGEIVVVYNLTESRCCILVDLLTDSKIGTVIYSNTKLNSEQKIQNIKKVIKRLTIAEKKELMAFLGRLDECRRGRNSIVHSSWVRVPRKDLWYGFGISKNSDLVKEIHSGEAEKLLKRLRMAEDQLLDILSKATLRWHDSKTTAKVKGN